MQRTTKTILTFSVPVLLLAALYFAVMFSVNRERVVGVVEPGPLTIGYSDFGFSVDPRDEFWLGIEPLRVRLQPQNARVPYGTKFHNVLVRGAYNDSLVAFMLEYEDQTENRDSLQGSDACAILLTPGNTPATTQMMGQGGSGNIWHWLATSDRERHQLGNDSVRAVRELITVGPGTQTPFAREFVDGRGEYGDGRWSVVFIRPLQSQQDGELTLAAESDLSISIAVWDGELVESFSRKSISILRTLNLERN